MVLVTGSWKLWAAGMAVSLAIFAIVFFAVIQPSQNTANQALKTGLQQSQQAINQAQKQLSSAAGATGATGAASAVAGAAQQQLSNALKLTTCVATAGTDAAKIQACQVQYNK